MENLTKINCAETTYVCNFRPSVNFRKDEKLFVGAVHDNLKNLNLYKSLLQFYISDLNLDSSKSIYLFLYLENIYPSTCNSVGVSISGNDTDLDVSNINWSTLPKKNNRTKININIPTNSVKKYLKIDISHVIKSLDSFNNTYTIIIEPINFYTASVIQFSSNACSNPPYLVLVNDSSNYNKNSFDNLEYDGSSDFETNININMDNLDKKDFYKEIRNELNTQQLRISSLEERLENITDYFNNINSTLKSSTEDIENKFLPTLDKFNENFSNLNNNINSLKDYFENPENLKDLSFDNLPQNLLNNLVSDLNELTKNELSQLKTSVNYDILELRKSVDTIMSTLDGSLNEVAKTLSLLYSKITTLSEKVENIILDPLDHKSI